MAKLKVFISSVKNEFMKEQDRVFRYLQTDTFISCFFEPANHHAPEKVSLDKVEHSNVYIGLLCKQDGYIERFGTGTGEIFRLVKDAGLREPLFDLGEGVKVIIWRPVVTTGQATGQAAVQVTEAIKRVVLVFVDEMKSAEIQEVLQLRHREYFRDNYLEPAINEGFVEMTIPEKPNSPIQKYRLTKKGEVLKNKHFKLTGFIGDSKTDHDTDYDTDYDTDHDTDHDEMDEKLIIVLSGQKSRPELMYLLGLKHAGNFRDNYLYPAIEKGYIEMTLPETPKSKKQEYRLTVKGQELKKQLEDKL